MFTATFSYATYNDAGEQVTVTRTQMSRSAAKANAWLQQTTKAFYSKMDWTLYCDQINARLESRNKAIYEWLHHVRFCVSNFYVPEEFTKFLYQATYGAYGGSRRPKAA